MYHLVIGSYAGTFIESFKTMLEVKNFVKTLDEGESVMLCVFGATRKVTL